MVVRCRISFFFFKAEMHYYMLHLKMHLSVDGYLDCFYILAIVNTVMLNMRVLIALQDLDLSSFG